MERAMKIEPMPWMEGHLVDMDSLHCQLTLENLENKPSGVFSKEINDYEEVFELFSESRDENQSEQEGTGGFFSWCRCCCRSKVHVETQPRRVFVKSDPGVGKTTFAKKLACKWAKKTWRRFAMVLFISLSLMAPQQTIEQAILDQHPWLEGMKVSEEKLSYLLDTFGGGCLLILDGLDEQVPLNRDVVRIIERRRLLKCSLLVTSRPHITKRFEIHFDTIVSVIGFTKEQAREFVSKMLNDPEKVDLVLAYNPVNYSGDTPLQNTPLLVSILCFLVNTDEDVDLFRERLETGEIYARMMKCIYRKYWNRQNDSSSIPSKFRNFKSMLYWVGKFAWKTLASGNPLMRRANLIAEVGAEIFDLGLLIGREAFRTFGDPTIDLLVTFPHRTIQEFLAAFYFVRMLSEGMSVEDLLGEHRQKPVFLHNPMFLEFCLWFLSSKQEHLKFKNEQQARTTFFSAIASYLDKVHCVISDFPTLCEISWRDPSGNDFWKEVFSRRKEISHLVLSESKQTEILRQATTETWPSLKSISVAHACLRSSIPPGHISVCLGHTGSEPWGEEFIKKVVSLGRSFGRYQFVLRCPEQLTNHMFQCFKTKDIAELWITDIRSQRALSIPNSPALTNLTLQGQGQLDAATLCGAQEVGRLPVLKQLTLHSFDLTGVVAVLLRSQWPDLVGLHFSACAMKQEDVDVLFSALSEGQILPSLKSFSLHQCWIETCRLPHIPPSALSKLESLDLNSRFQTTGTEPGMLTNAVNCKSMVKLHIGNCYWGVFAAFLSVSLPQLEDFTLEANNQVLGTLAQACLQKRFPGLEHLGINFSGDDLSHLFPDGCTWNQLVSLRVSNNNGCGEVLSRKRREDCLSNLEKLSISEGALLAVLSTRWPQLCALLVVSRERTDGQVDVSALVLKAMGKDFLPALRVVAFRNASRDGYELRQENITTFGLEKNEDLLR